MRADATTESAVEAALDRVFEGYAARDWDILRAAFAPEIVSYDTEGKRVGLAQVKAVMQQDWTQCEGLDLCRTWTSLSVVGSMAWVAADVTFTLKTDGRETVLPTRSTFVLEKRGTEWLTVHSHFSVSAQA
jgi:hypothetical protein